MNVEFNMTEIDQAKAEVESCYDEAKGAVITDAAHVGAEATIVGKAAETVTSAHLETWGEKIKEWISAEFKKLKGEL
jgi:hypothetical protein